MQMKMFVVDWPKVDYQSEDAINEFLASLPKGAVKFVHTAASATRTSDTDQHESELVVTVWYEGTPKKAKPKPKR